VAVDLDDEVVALVRPERDRDAMPPRNKLGQDDRLAALTDIDRVLARPDGLRGLR
jgi:hypothetical protein